MESRIQSLEHQLKAAKEKTPPGAKKVKGGGKKSIQGILKKKGDPAAKKTTARCAPHAPRDAQDKNNKGTACAKGKMQQKGRKVSFEKKKVTSRTNSRK